MIINYSSLTPVLPHGPNHSHVVIDDRLISPLAVASKVFWFSICTLKVSNMACGTLTWTHIWHLFKCQFIPVYLAFHVFRPNRRSTQFQNHHWQVLKCGFHLNFVS